MDRYRLIDSGGGRKLEAIGGVTVERQAATAFWSPRLSPAEWRQVDARHVRSSSGGGHWEQVTKNLPADWNVAVGPLQLKSKLTSFGHCGFFAEQSTEWQFFLDWQKRRAPGAPPLQALNLFGYTGASSLALGLGGAHCTHVDAAKGIVDWAKENATLNEVPNDRLRFITEDCQKFIDREIRRGKRYNALLLDPPSYGRGPNGEIFKIEEAIGPMLKALAQIVVDPELIHFSCHTPGFGPKVLKNLLLDHFNLVGMREELFEMSVYEETGRDLSSGFCAKFWRE